jgi:signal transduction histidine kinase
MDAASAPQHPIRWQDLGAELAFTQDSSGRYSSFYWQCQSKRPDASPSVLTHQNPEHEKLKPVAADNYLETIHRVMERRVPENYHCLFVYEDKTFPVELAISPILKHEGRVTEVLVMGRLLEQDGLTRTNRLTGTLPHNNYNDLVTQIARNIRRNPYQNLLTKISRNIRLTLDLETIWQQTVDSLGAEVRVTRCLIIAYDAETQTFRVESEYCEPSYRSMLGERFPIDRTPYLEQAISVDEPLAFDYIQDSSFEERSVLVISTFYQNKRNALICLQQCDHRRHWNDAEIELVRELAAHVGTAIAHATLYKELEEAGMRAEEASRLKSEFLASTSHELRTPLNGIIGFMKLILDGMADDPAEQREFLEEAHRSALHLLNLINDILDIAKIEAGRMELNFTEVPLETLFDDVEKKTRPMAQQKNLSFEIQLPPSREPIVLYGNYQRLLQVMLNLVGNAVKFTHEGGITISAEVVKKQMFVDGKEFPGLVKVRVADTGIGVPLDKLDMLFKNFSQVDIGRTRSYGGTGLGLAISQRLVETMGGKIDFFSMGESLGSTVTFEVPIVQIPLMTRGKKAKNSL